MGNEVSSSEEGVEYNNSSTESTRDDTTATSIDQKSGSSVTEAHDSEGTLINNNSNISWEEILKKQDASVNDIFGGINDTAVANKFMGWIWPFVVSDLKRAIHKVFFSYVETLDFGHEAPVIVEPIKLYPLSGETKANSKNKAICIDVFVSYKPQNMNIVIKNLDLLGIKSLTIEGKLYLTVYFSHTKALIPGVQIYSPDYPLVEVGFQKLAETIIGGSCKDRYLEEYVLKPLREHLVLPRSFYFPVMSVDHPLTIWKYPIVQRPQPIGLIQFQLHGIHGGLFREIVQAAQIEYEPVTFKIVFKIGGQVKFETQMFKQVLRYETQELDLQCLPVDLLVYHVEQKIGIEIVDENAVVLSKLKSRILVRNFIGANGGGHSSENNMTEGKEFAYAAKYFPVQFEPIEDDLFSTDNERAYTKRELECINSTTTKNNYAVYQNQVDTNREKVMFFDFAFADDEEVSTSTKKSNSNSIKTNPQYEESANPNYIGILCIYLRYVKLKESTTKIARVSFNFARAVDEDYYHLNGGENNPFLLHTRNQFYKTYPICRFKPKEHSVITSKNYQRVKKLQRLAPGVTASEISELLQLPERDITEILRMQRVETDRVIQFGDFFPVEHVLWPRQVDKILIKIEYTYYISKLSINTGRRFDRRSSSHLEDEEICSSISTKDTSATAGSMESKSPNDVDCAQAETIECVDCVELALDEISKRKNFICKFNESNTALQEIALDFDFAAFNIMC